MSFVYYKKGEFIQAYELAKGAKENQDQLKPGVLEALCKKA
jgi:hypothetical protein